MIDVVSPEEAIEAGAKLREYVDGSAYRSWEHDGNTYRVFTLELDSPRTIGRESARFLRVVKGLSGPLQAGAQYTREGLEPHPDTGIAREMPLRVINFFIEGPPLYHFNGSMDARDYSLPREMMTDLLADIS